MGILKKIAVLVIPIALTLVLGACASGNTAVKEDLAKQEVEQKESVKEEVKNIAENENLEELYNEVDKAKADVSKNNKLTEDEMLKIGKGLREDFVTQFYNIKDDEQLESFLGEFYIEENQIRFDTFQKSYKENIDVYKSGVIVLSDDSVEHYGETGFVYKATAEETATKFDKSTKSATYNITLNIDVDDDGKYKITAETID